jgi:hypothetical protein
MGLATFHLVEWLVAGNIIHLWLIS